MSKSKSVTYSAAVKNAVHVTDEVGLKTAVKQGKLVIISSDPQLYKKMLSKFPKEKVTKNVRTAGKVMTGIGAVAAVMTGGIIGIPMAILGIAGTVGGKFLDYFKDYTIQMDYEEKQVLFIKTKGDVYVKMGK